MHHNMHNDTVTHSGAKTAVNLIAFLTVIGGTVFKMMHWPGADMLILASTVALLATIFYLYKDMNVYGSDSTTTMMLSGFMFLLMVGTLFRRMHWEGARILGFASLALAIIVALYLIFKKEEMRLPKQFAIVTVLYLIYIAGAGFVSARAAEILEANMPN